MHNRGARARHRWAGLGVAGLILVITGAFLPWARSGRTERDSFEFAGIADRIAGEPALEIGLGAWIAMPLLCVTCVPLYVLGLARISAALTAVLAAATGAIAVLTLTTGNANGPISVIPLGPGATAAGSALALTGAVGVFLAHRRTAVRITD